MEGGRLELGVEQLAGYFRDFLTFPGSQKLSVGFYFSLCVCSECQIGIFPWTGMVAARMRFALQENVSRLICLLYLWENGGLGVDLSPLVK